MKASVNLFFISIVLLLSSCSKKINPEKPILTASNFKLDSLPYSEINIPIRVNLKPMYEMAESHVDTLFTSPDYPDTWIQPGCDTRYKYSFRRGPLQLSASGNMLNLGFTGFYRIIGSTRVCVAGVAVSPWTAPCKCGFDEAERRVNVSFTNNFSVQPDYKVKLAVHRNEPEAIDKCEVCFFKQDITKQVLTGLNEELDSAKTSIERSYGTVDLKPQFQQLWNSLSRVYHVYDMGWLQINPQRIHINNLYAKDDSLYIYLGLAARPVISLDKPVEQVLAVPNMSGLNRQQGFSIFFDANLDYDSLSVIMNRYLVGKEFDLNKGPVRKHFIFKDCKLYGEGNEKLVIRVTFGGSNEGTFYLTGRPTYEKETHILELKDVDFDIRSRNALLKTAEWLFSRKIVNEIAKTTRFDLTAYIDSTKANVTHQINQEWRKGIRSEGNIQDINLVGLYPLERSLLIRSNCTGELSIKVDSIDFTL